MFENLTRTYRNIPERALLGRLFGYFTPPLDYSTLEWVEKHRVITRKETSFGVGKFDTNLTPYMEYVYECLDSIYIPYIVSRKSARVAWTETLNNYRGKRIHVDPCQMLLGFATKEAAKKFGKGKWKDFLDNVTVLRDLVNAGIPISRRSLFEYYFPYGSLTLATLGAISNQKSDNYEYIEVEEPDDAKDEVKGQGDTFANLRERQKLVPIYRRKFIFGGTPTNEGFSRVDNAYEQSNQLIFKAECHHCKSLVRMDYAGFEGLKYDEYQNGYIDAKFGKYNPETAHFLCPECRQPWTFEEKNQNIINGKKYGFIDHTGNFSKGWHALRPENTEIFGFGFSELLSPFDGSHFIELAKADITSLLALEKGNESLRKSYYNNKQGRSYSSGITMLSMESMKELRRNYAEGICPYEGLVVTMGIDVQENRFAYSQVAWDDRNNLYLIKWTEIFGDVKHQQIEYTEDGEIKFLGIWGLLTEICLSSLKHATGKDIPISAISIDSGHLAEEVYTWVKYMSDRHPHVFATKGNKELKYSDDEIYQEPNLRFATSDNSAIKSKAETMGVILYHVGAHRAHDEVLLRISRNAIKEATRGVFYFNEQSYGMFEEQMISCRKIVDPNNPYGKTVYKLIPGKRKEAIDTCKLALHAGYAIQIRTYTDEHWYQLREYYQSIT